jgi:hypothetical protein
MLLRLLSPQLVAPMVGEVQHGMMPAGPEWWAGSWVVR